MKWIFASVSLAIIMASTVATLPPVDSDYIAHEPLAIPPSPEPRAIVFSDNFDGESDGDSPPTNWVEDASHTWGANFEVDNVYSSSGANSMWLADDVGLGFCHHDVSWTTENFTVEIYPETLTIYGYIVTQSSTGNFLAGSIAVYMNFDNSGNIRYHNGVDWQDTGTNYNANAWNEIAIVHNLGADTFDAWHNDIQIVNDGGFYASQSQLRSIQLGLSTTGAEKELWVDNVQVGDADSTLPEIVNVADTPDPQEYAGYVNVTADVTDETAIDEVYLNVTHPDSTYTNTSMSAGAADEYYLNTTYSQLGTHTYFIWANDTSDNKNMSSTATFLIQDTTLPEVANVTDAPDPQEYLQYLNITANITDNVAVFGAWVNITLPNATYQNDSMTQGAVNEWHLNQTYTLVGLHNYTIWANDTSDNWNSSAEYNFTIQDTTIPEIYNLSHTPHEQEAGDYVNITANITDYSGVDTAILHLLIHASMAGAQYPMIQGAGNEWYSNRTYTTVSRYDYAVWANDTYGNNNQTGWSSFWVNDTTPPLINLTNVEPNLVYPFTTIFFTCVVWDLSGVDGCWVNITYPDSSFVNASMSNIVGNNWSYDQVVITPGNYSAIFWVNDTYGNANYSAPNNFTVLPRPYGGVARPSVEEVVIGLPNITDEKEFVGFLAENKGQLFLIIILLTVGYILVATHNKKKRQR